MVPTPTLLVVLSTKSVFVSTVRSPPTLAFRDAVKSVVATLVPENEEVVMVAPEMAVPLSLSKVCERENERESALVCMCAVSAVLKISFRSSFSTMSKSA